MNIDFASRPVVAVIAVVIHEGHALLVRRANPPDAGLWGFPGGKIEPGEPLMDAVQRELYEETAVSARPIRVFNAVDVFDRDESGNLKSHHVLVAVSCEWMKGEPLAGDDALDARWVRLDELACQDLMLSADVERIADQAASLV
ncbi:NUDIX hydrolase [Marinobacterium lutimaris]|uniref:ADP-ribose pyrophosphatase YjhB, NUDIX family n=1 Tax=Marinobacterium lutimaris TaxID=568106 RepID=A0A1H5VNX3_9GAMM|nr:NUDIX hydrolase [Marinobacterium lutimaris]SEF88716.1 ADP-ribose pyrophosphatase YjhB, NUDIX family [Marinobacterium lutimaris]